MTNASIPASEVGDSHIQTQVQDSLSRQRAFFSTGETRSLRFRRTQLQQLKENITAVTENIYTALAADLGKCKTEAYLSGSGPSNRRY